MIYGYARVSTEDQNLTSQLDALVQYGCDKIYKEKISGRTIQRKELTKVLKKLKKDDTLVVWKLDRLGRTTRQLIDLTSTLRENGIEFVSLRDSIDTTTPIGRFFLTLMAGFAEMEVELIRERTMAGLDAARRRGIVGGRPSISPAIIEKIDYLYNNQNLSGHEIANQLSISSSSVYKYVRIIQEKKKRVTG